MHAHNWILSDLDILGLDLRQQFRNTSTARSKRTDHANHCRDAIRALGPPPHRCLHHADAIATTVENTGPRCPHPAQLAEDGRQIRICRHPLACTIRHLEARRAPPVPSTATVGIRRRTIATLAIAVSRPSGASPWRRPCAKGKTPRHCRHRPGFARPRPLAAARDEGGRRRVLAAAGAPCPSPTGPTWEGM